MQRMISFPRPKRLCSWLRHGLLAALVLAGLVIPLPPNSQASSQVNTHIWTYLSATPGASLGEAISSAGDVNGDGFDDILVGSHLIERNDDLQAEGAAFLFYGSAAGPEPEPAWASYGGALFAHYGWAVSSAGDVNGDGFADVAISANNCTDSMTSTGVVYVFYGSPAGLPAAANWTMTGSQANACFGYALASAGDVNGDSFDDLLVGAPTYEAESLTDEGAVFLYYGAAAGLNSTPQRVFLGGQAHARLGEALAAGDFNGDGFSDVVLGAPGFSNGQAGEGQAQVFYGSAAGPSAAADWSHEGDQLGARYGSALAGAGDVDGDGYSDLLVGADLWDVASLVNAGRAFLYPGGPGGLSPDSLWTFNGDKGDGRLGRSLAGVGDLDGDGFADILLGASHYSDPENAEGRVFVFYGASGGPATSPDWFHELNQANAMLGFAVSEAGDVNHDGYADMMVGAPGYESSRQLDEGLVIVFHGEPDGLSDPVLNLSLTPNPAQEASAADLLGSFTVADPTASFTLTVDWGDGSPDTVLPLGVARFFDVAHSYADSGVYLITATVEDGAGVTLQDSLEASVTNTAPTLTLSGPQTASEGLPYALGISAVVDPGADTVSACQIDWGDGSPLQDCLAALDGSLAHTFADGPAAHSIQVQLTDEDGVYPSVAAHAVEVANLPPVAGDDEFKTPPGAQTTIAAPGVLENDQDVAADALSASLVSGVSAGELVLHPDGSFTFTPPSGFAGELSFTYQALDEDGGVSNTATATLTVDYLYLYLPAVAHPAIP